MTVEHSEHSGLYQSGPRRSKARAADPNSGAPSHHAAARKAAAAAAMVPASHASSTAIPGADGQSHRAIPHTRASGTQAAAVRAMLPTIAVPPIGPRRRRAAHTSPARLTYAARDAAAARPT